MRRWFPVLAVAIIGGFVASATAAQATPVRKSLVGTLGVPANVTGLDLHDGMMYKAANAYYLVGTEYGCGFTWQQHNTPWCGFGVSTAPAPTGPWTAPTLLFSPSALDPWTGTTWQVECGATGAGCFNPRMVQRTWGPADGVWLLWFNAPADYARTSANPYYVMGCNGPGGTCGYDAPNGSVHKPSLWTCGGNGDFALVTDNGSNPHMLCTNADQTLSEEALDIWGANGVQGSGTTHLAGLTSTESPGAYHDAGGTWILTYSDPNCGYCAGTATGFATSTSIAGPWTAPADVGVAAPANGRRDISATSCGGQPRTVSIIDGQPYEGIDIWNGSLNETTAATHFEPLTYRGQSGVGQLWQPFAPWGCQ